VANDETLREIARLVARASDINPAEVRPEGRLRGYGIDSARVVDLVLDIEEQFGVTVRERDFPSLQTVVELADHVEKLKGT
jgi:acyl carrier protein